MYHLTYEQMRLAVMLALVEVQKTTITFETMRRWAADHAHRKEMGEPGAFDDEFRGDDAWLCDQVLWDLACEGIIAPVVERYQPGHPPRERWLGGTFRITVRGLASIQGDALSLHDRDGYLKGVQKACAGMACAPTVLMYAEEAIRSYHARIYLGATFLVGAATDAAVAEVIDAFAASDLPEPKMVADHASMERRGVQLNARFQWFTKALHDSRQSKNTQPSAQAFLADKDLGDWQAQLLEGLAHTMSARNAAGHHERTPPTADDAHASLVQLRANLGRLRRLAAHFRAHPAP